VRDNAAPPGHQLNPTTQAGAGFRAYAAAIDLVPVVDIADPRDPSLAALDRACRDHGFFLLRGHDLHDVVERAFAAARTFFAAAMAVKEAVRRDEANPLGYTDRELTKRRRDRKEAFDFVDPSSGRAMAHNRWPELDGFHDAMVVHYDACSDLAGRTADLVLAALGLSPGERSPYGGDRTVSSMRLNHYTIGDPVVGEQRAGLADLADVSLGQHTDLGLLTLLIQDDVGGLQTHSDEHGWIDIEPRPGTIVVNLGDCMQVLTNDRYRAALHRVVPMTSSTRLSIPYFFNPGRDAVIEPVPALAGGHPNYRAFPFRQLLAARSADNYADLGAPDAQISDYRIERARE
jgi:isopenicillin N synthase-like dioxygenase